MRPWMLMMRWTWTVQACSDSFAMSCLDMYACWRGAHEACPFSLHLVFSMSATPAENGTCEPDSVRPKLSKETQVKLANILLQLATTAQYSKVIQSGCGCPLTRKLAHLLPPSTQHACSLIYSDSAGHVASCWNPHSGFIRDLSALAEMDTHSATIIRLGL